MNTSPKFELLINKHSPKIPMPIIRAMRNRLEQVENEFMDVVGYYPGKPKGKEHRSWREIFGI